MQESRKLHDQCPSCGATKDFDTPVARHYTCGALGSFTSGKYQTHQAKIAVVFVGTADALAPRQPERTLQ